MKQSDVIEMIWVEVQKVGSLSDLALRWGVRLQGDWGGSLF
jgi:hypothetical protein